MNLMTPSNYKKFIDGSYYEVTGRAEGYQFLVDQTAPNKFNLAYKDSDWDFDNLDDLFSAKLIDGKCINDFKEIDVSLE